MCGGIYVDEQGAQVPVTPGPPREDDEGGHRLWEYVTRDGAVRGCLLHVAAGHTTAWRIKPEAGDDGYYERQARVHGEGVLRITADDGAGASTPLHPRAANEAVRIDPGDTFTTIAGQHSDVYVLATFPGAPFKPSYEELASV
jgi:hypothetical protein